MMIRICILFAVTILPVLLFFYVKEETPKEREVREGYGKMVNEALKRMERRNNMTVERFRALSGYTDNPIEGTESCFSHGDMIFCLDKTEIGKAVDHAVEKGAKDINVGYSDKDDLWYIVLTD